MLPGAVRIESVEHCVLDSRVMNCQIRVNYNQILTEQGKHSRGQSPHL